MERAFQACPSFLSPGYPPAPPAERSDQARAAGIFWDGPKGCFGFTVDDSVSAAENVSDLKRLEELFRRRFAGAPERLAALRAHGSERRIYRLTGAGRQVVGVVNADVAENRAFLSFSRHFRGCGLPVPEILACDDEGLAYLEEDLGDETLFAMLQRLRGDGAGVPETVAAVYDRVVRWLPEIQVRAGRDLDYAACHPRSRFDRQSMMWDLSYFKYYFLKLARVPFQEQELENDFVTLTDFLLQAPSEYFLFRDFQSRNVMVRDGEPWFIDYQGGRRGALHYDLASLLVDAKADLPRTFRLRLLESYLEALARHVKVNRAEFEVFFDGFTLIRVLQAMGAYGYRGFYERKTHFLQSVPYAIRNLEYLLGSSRIPAPLPALRGVLETIVRSTRLRDVAPTSMPLTVRIESFSFKRGWPVDRAGHGGGFVFDCRLLPNPGREARFTEMAGDDAEVGQWLEAQEEARLFFARTSELVLQAIESLSTPAIHASLRRIWLHGGTTSLRFWGRAPCLVAAGACESACRTAPPRCGPADGAAIRQMRAMVLAAGRGTRLGALTATRPKALVEIRGVTLLEHVLRRLRTAGVTDVIINTHHCGEQIEAFIAQRHGLGLAVAFSREVELLDTGGGLKQAAWYFSDGHPFLVHNVDVLSDLDLAGMVRAHEASGALAMLAVKSRPTSRPLVFDADLQLVGRLRAHGREIVRATGAPACELGFCGVHVISPSLLPQLTETGSFSIIDSYLRLAADGAAILGHRVDSCRWRDCGRPEDLRPLEP